MWKCTYKQEFKKCTMDIYLIIRESLFQNYKHSKKMSLNVLIFKMATQKPLVLRMTFMRLSLNIHYFGHILKQSLIISVMEWAHQNYNEALNFFFFLMGILLDKMDIYFSVFKSLIKIPHESYWILNFENKTQVSLFWPTIFLSHQI